MKKLAFVTDFDGTITHNDFFHMVIDAYFEEKDLQPWYDYKAGKKDHFDALSSIFGKIRADKKDFDALINTIDVDEDFAKVLSLCKEKGVPVYVVSAGSSYYIKRKVGELLSEYDVELIANGGGYSPKTGMKMIKPPSGYVYFDDSVGVSKAKVVRDLQSKGFFVIFAGDGDVDFEAAKEADVVFAKSDLLQKCRKTGVEAKFFKSFKDIVGFMERM